MFSDNISISKAYKLEDMKIIKEYMCKEFLCVADVAEIWKE